jgi:hypothetical protein
MAESIKAEEMSIEPMPLAMRIASRTFDCYLLGLALLFFIGGLLFAPLILISFVIFIAWLLCRKDERVYLITVPDVMYPGIMINLFGFLHFAFAFVMMLRILEVRRINSIHVGILSIPTAIGVWLIIVGYFVLKSRAEYREWRRKWVHTLDRNETDQIRPPVLG